MHFPWFPRPPPEENRALIWNEQAQRFEKAVYAQILRETPSERMKQ
jgi:hypothetical protein